MDGNDASLTWSWTTGKGWVITTLSFGSEHERSLENSVNGSTLELGKSNALLTACEMLVKVEVKTFEIVVVIGTI